MNKKDELVFAFDLGVASVGSGVTNLTAQEILHAGSHTWDASQDRLGRTLCSIRRGYRSQRRSNRRKAHRKERVKNAFVRNSLLTKEEINQILHTQSPINVYQLRLDALDRIVTNDELLRIFVKLAKNRGFKSNRKSDINEKELKKLEKDLESGATSGGDVSEGVMNSAIALNDKIMLENGYRTAGEMLMKHPNFIDKKKNSGGTYLVTLSRKLILDEAKIILDSQIKLGNSNITPEFRSELLDILSKQRPFASGEDIVKMVGLCTFEGENKNLSKIEYLRSPKTTFSAAKFLIWQNLNNLKLIHGTGEVLPLSQEQKNTVYSKILTSSGPTTYKNVRTYLKLDKNTKFSGLRYEESKKDKDKFIQLTAEEVLKEAEKTKFVDLSDFLKIHKALKVHDLTEEQLDIVGWVLSYYKTDEDIHSELSKYNFSEDVIEDALKIILPSSVKPMHLGLKALRSIASQLEKGVTYDKACSEVGYDFRNLKNDKEKTKYLPEIPKDEIVNHTVFKTLCRARLVLNALIDKYGSPSMIVVESARELSHSKKTKDRIAAENKKNEALKAAHIEMIKKFAPDVEIKESHLKKVALWKEQDERCIYTGKYIDLISLLHDDNLCQIDHILPYSRSWDNSHMNKVLVYTSANQEKSNKTPFEWLGHNEYDWSIFKERVSSNPKIPYKKKLNLLNVDFKDSEKDFLNRNLHDTAYATTYFAKFLSDHLEFAPSDRKKKVITVKGSVTSKIRYSLGLEKDRSTNIHHAVDAMLLTVVDHSFIKKVSDYNRLLETKGRHLVKKEGIKFPMPWDNFNYMLDKKADEVIVSKFENLKESGSCHDDTSYAYHGEDETGAVIISKNVPISQLKLKNEQVVYDNLTMKESHPLYSVVKSKLESGEKLTTLYTPTKNGTPNPITKVKLYGLIKGGNYTLIQGGKSIKTGGDLIRGDLYEKDGTFYCVPIYAGDIRNKKFIKRAITINKPKNAWIVIDDSFNFKFSIRKNTLVKVITKAKGSKESTEIIGYAAPHIHVKNNTFTVIYEGNENAIPFKSISSIEKLEIDILGNLK